MPNEYANSGYLSSAFGPFALGSDPAQKDFQVREAFDLKSEPDSIKDEYGRSAPGQRMLLARRLIEGGVRFVSLTAGGWDHHDNLKAGIERELPSTDKAIAALIRDLDRRGMLDSTLVMVTTEFGRTPKINPTGGRDHWPRVFSTMLAGGGMKQGYVHGSSDSLGGEVDTDGVGVEDLAATVYHQIGINSDSDLMSPGNRPIGIVDGGTVLDSLLAKKA